MAAIPGDLPPGLLPSDEWLLRLVLEEHVDPDIGAEFGLSAGEARQRIALLAAKLDVNGREGLVRRFGTSAMAGASATARHGRFRRTWLVAGAALALAAIGTVSVLAATRGGSSAAQSEATRQAAIAAASTAAASAQVARENPGGWLDLGPFIVVDGSPSPIYSTSQRAVMTVVTMAGPGVIPLQGSGAHWTKAPSDPPGFAELYSFVGKDIPVHLVLVAGAETRLISDSSGVVRVYSVSAATKPVLLVQARVGVGAGPDPNRRTVNVSPSGRLFLSSAPIPPDVAVDQSTGAALDLRHTTKLGDVGGGVAENICNGDLSHDNGGSCSLVWSAALRPFISPVAGTVRCLASGPIEFEGSTFRLRILGGGRPTGCSADPGRAVKSGDVIVPAGKYYITATTNDPYLSAAKQLPLSVVMAGSTLYVGTIHLTAGCPCLVGN